MAGKAEKPIGLRSGRSDETSCALTSPYRYATQPYDIPRHRVPRGDKNISCSLLIIFQSKKRRVCLKKNDDFADDNEVTNEKQADEQSTGDHEDSDEEGVQGPPHPTDEFKRLGQGLRETGSSSLPSSECIRRHLRSRSTTTSRSSGSRDNQGTNV